MFSQIRITRFLLGLFGGQTLAVGLEVTVQATLALTFLAGLSGQIVVVLLFKKIVGHSVSFGFYDLRERGYLRCAEAKVSEKSVRF